MYETSHRLRKYQCFFSSGPLHYCNGLYFLEMAHNFGNPGAIGPYPCFAFPISVISMVMTKNEHNPGDIVPLMMKDEVMFNNTLTTLLVTIVFLAKHCSFSPSDDRPS